MDAGVPIKRPVAGIAMGLIERVKEDGSSEFAILSDIQGMEDFLGDMDFKVTGTASRRNGDPDGYQGTRLIQRYSRKGAQTGEGRQNVHHGQDARRNPCSASGNVQVRTACAFHDD